MLPSVQIDILVNCAGGNVAGATVGPADSFFKMPTAAMQQVFDLNIIGTVLPSQVFGESMHAGGRGNIINISSMSAQSAITRVCGYSAAKAAVDNFTKWLAVELALKCVASQYHPRVSTRNTAATVLFVSMRWWWSWWLRRAGWVVPSRRTWLFLLTAATTTNTN